ncbi:unnamed protein product [Durusdinium trenchii]
MPVGYLCADFVAKGLLRADLEPMTLAPGRWQCTSTDVERLLYTWSVRLRQAYDLTHLPRLGAFGVFRESFKELSFSVVLEPSPGEVLKDLFQYITGVCWYFFMKSEDFVAQVGVVFLLYLLFHCQREQRYAIPVNVEILEKVHVVRKRCMSEQILLEFPAALRYLVQEQALSVGLRASYRNLFFDKYGHLLERKALASAHGRGRAERGATHETPLPDTRAWHRMKAKEKPVEVHIPAPPDVSHLEAQLKSYEDLRDGASGAGEVDRSLSQRMKRLAEASAVFEKSVPVPTEDLEHEAKAPVPKQRRLKRRRVFEDSEDEVEVPKAVPVMELRQEGPPGEEAFRQVRVTSPELQNSRVLGLDAAVQQGTADQLLKQVEEEMRKSTFAAWDETFARPSRASADQAKAETMPEEKEELPELQPIKLPDPPAAPPERTDRPAFDVRGDGDVRRRMRAEKKRERRGCLGV